MGNELFKDSPIIIEALVARLRETGGMTDEEHAIFCSPDAQKWAEWADKQLAVLLFPNLTRNFSESYQVRLVNGPLYVEEGRVFSPGFVTAAEYVWQIYTKVNKSRTGARNSAVT